MDNAGVALEEGVVAQQKLAARVDGVFAAPFDHFETRSVDALELGFDGIANDFHAGITRKSGGREPWYPRGTEMRNERQLTIVSPDELAIIARRMNLPEIKSEWIGANLLVSGLPRLSFLPAGSLLFFRNGVTLKVDAMNHPCRLAGRAIAENAKMPDHKVGALEFARQGRRLRGLTAWVEKPGRIVAGEEITVRVPEQWIYRA
ncbi:MULTISPECIES: MOSC domain-containing protein [Mesorhizobium]|uniref:Molybdenum cofactor sulfurase n=1 Tax=Mesorhizobium denitrificans TaxID=2294114 RepID=A0A371XG81_9HYPH|nr:MULTISPECIES: molybdenum cofactor sulfurase [Mesorhizobium]RFC68237.1 molybdenum cofactor sulfurase [Mesorhizobium denitrificans]